MREEPVDAFGVIVALLLAALIWWGCLASAAESDEVGRDCSERACPVWLHCRADVRQAGSRTCEFADCYRNDECADGQLCHDLACASRESVCAPAKLEVLP